MAIFLGIVSQKGGVGKSTLARLVAREYAEAGWDVKIADLSNRSAKSKCTLLGLTVSEM